jgi:hypothetical protein
VGGVVVVAMAVSSEWNSAIQAKKVSARRQQRNRLQYDL